MTPGAHQRADERITLAYRTALTGRPPPGCARRPRPGAPARSGRGRSSWTPFTRTTSPGATARSPAPAPASGRPPSRNPLPTSLRGWPGVDPRGTLADRDQPVDTQPDASRPIASCSSPEPLPSSSIGRAPPRPRAGPGAGQRGSALSAARTDSGSHCRRRRSRPRRRNVHDTAIRPAAQRDGGRQLPCHRLQRQAETERGRGDRQGVAT